MEVFLGKDEVFPLAITEAVLGKNVSPKIRARILGLWVQTLRSLRVEVYPEAAHMDDLVVWLEAIRRELA